MLALALAALGLQALAPDDFDLQAAQWVRDARLTERCRTHARLEAETVEACVARRIALSEANASPWPIAPGPAGRARRACEAAPAAGETLVACIERTESAAPPGFRSYASNPAENRPANPVEAERSSRRCRTETTSDADGRTTGGALMCGDPALDDTLRSLLNPP